MRPVHAPSQASQTALTLYSPAIPPDFASPSYQAISAPAQPSSSAYAPTDPAVELRAAGLSYLSRPRVAAPTAISHSAQLRLLKLAGLPCRGRDNRSRQWVAVRTAEQAETSRLCSRFNQQPRSRTLRNQGWPAGIKRGCSAGFQRL